MLTGRYGKLNNIFGDNILIVIILCFVLEFLLFSFLMSKIIKATNQVKSWQLLVKNKFFEIPKALNSARADLINYQKELNIETTAKPEEIGKFAEDLISDIAKASLLPFKFKRKLWIFVAIIITKFWQKGFKISTLTNNSAIRGTLEH